MAAELGKRLWRRTAHAIRKPVVPAREPSPEAMASETIPKVLIIHQPQRGKKKILKEENKDLMGLRDFHMIGKGCFCVQLPECRKMGARRREEGHVGFKKQHNLLKGEQPVMTSLYPLSLYSSSVFIKSFHKQLHCDL